MHKIIQGLVKIDALMLIDLTSHAKKVKCLICFHFYQTHIFPAPFLPIEISFPIMYFDFDAKFPFLNFQPVLSVFLLAVNGIIYFLKM